MDESVKTVMKIFSIKGGEILGYVFDHQFLREHCSTVRWIIHGIIAPLLSLNIPLHHYACALDNRWRYCYKYQIICSWIMQCHWIVFMSHVVRQLGKNNKNLSNFNQNFAGARERVEVQKLYPMCDFYFTANYYNSLDFVRKLYNHISIFFKTNQ